MRIQVETTMSQLREFGGEMLGPLKTGVPVRSGQKENVGKRALGFHPLMNIRVQALCRITPAVAELGRVAFAEDARIDPLQIVRPGAFLSNRGGRAYGRLPCSRSHSIVDSSRAADLHFCTDMF